MKPKKKVKEQPVKKVEKPEVKQRLVAKRNVEKLKSKGWKVVGSPKDKQGKIEGVRTHDEDLILMEKG